MPVQTADTATNVVLDELVKWVRTLGQAGVSPDKAVEVARDFLLAACMEDHDGEEYDEDYDEDDEE